MHSQLKDDWGHSQTEKQVQEEVRHYKETLDRNRTKYKIVDEQEQKDGSVIIKIIKQNNNSPVGDYLD